MDQVRSIRYIILLFLISALTAYTYMLRYRRIEEPQLPALESIPKRIGDFTGRDEHQEPESLHILGADATIFRSYCDKEERTIWLFLGYFRLQQENSQIHSPKHCYPGYGWNIIEEGSTGITLGKRRVPVKHLTISDGKETQVVLYWFSTHNCIITNEFTLKWQQMKSALMGKPQSATFIRFSTKVAPGEEQNSTREGLIEFVEKISPDIEKVLQGAAPAAVSSTEDDTSFPQMLDRLDEHRQPVA